MYYYEREKQQGEVMVNQTRALVKITKPKHGPKFNSGCEIEGSNLHMTQDDGRNMAKTAIKNGLKM